MNQALRHRGPDDEGLYFDHTGSWHIGLGHRRLSIIDLSKDGRQPLFNENNSVALVANGEIYNHKEIRNRLRFLGHHFRSQCDSEVILHAYEQWGTDCLNKIKGMFAFAIWDANSETLFMARDLFGEKPLFYALNGNTLTFASELPALLGDNTISGKLDTEALMEYLYYQVTFPPKTIIKDIRKLPPAHYAIFRKGELKLKDYGAAAIVSSMNTSKKGVEEFVEEVRDLLECIIEPLMISDVPIGIFLSGGLDSSLILSFMAKKACRPVHTFSIGFDQDGFNELPWARRMARHFGACHHEDVVSYNIAEILPKLIHHLGEPMADSSIIPYYYLSKMAASEVKVVLGGDGADEIWGGYRRHLLRPYLPLFAMAAPVTEKMLSLFHAGDGYYASSIIESLRMAQQLSLSQKTGYTPWNPLFDLREMRSLLSPSLYRHMEGIPLGFLRRLKTPDKTRDRVNRMLSIDQMTFLPEDILTKVDRMSMAHSLEVRSPFLHPEVASLAANIPGRLKIRRGTGKRILKMAARDHLPQDIIHRKKHGFSVPVDAWFRGEGYGFARDTLLDGSFVQDRYIEKAYLQKLLAEHRGRRVNHGRKLWSLIVLEMWQEQFAAV